MDYERQLPQICSSGKFYIHTNKHSLQKTYVKKPHKDGDILVN